MTSDYPAISQAESVSLLQLCQNLMLIWRTFLKTCLVCPQTCNWEIATHRDWRLLREVRYEVVAFRGPARPTSTRSLRKSFNFMSMGIVALRLEQ